MLTTPSSENDQRKNANFVKNRPLCAENWAFPHKVGESQTSETLRACIVHCPIYLGVYQMNTFEIHNLHCLHYYKFYAENFLNQNIFVNTFDSLEAATRARENLNGADIYSGCCTLKIDYAKVSTMLYVDVNYLLQFFLRLMSLEHHVPLLIFILFDLT